MRRYLVGGSVRDGLLGRPVSDRDWVVVGAHPDDLIGAGYTPVGRDFPVFLHPQTREEHALARTERKTGPGYRGFVVHADPSVTLEDDLLRRDLTINAIAEDEQGVLIDPHGGRADLAAKVLRHVSPAFVEDPVRILRVARFAARFPDFTVAEETLALMRGMVEAGEVDALVPERVWQELSRGLMEAHPARMFEVLRACGALARLLPEVDRLFGVPQRADHHPEVDTGVHLLMVLEIAARLDAKLTVRFACLGHDLGKGTTPADVLPRHIGHEQRSVALVRALCERLRVPSDCRELAELVAAEHGNVHRSGEFGASALVRLFERGDAFRRPQRFADLLLACECDARGRLGMSEAAYPQGERLLRMLTAALAVDARRVADAAIERGKTGPAIGDCIRAARVRAVDAAIAPPADVDGEAVDAPIDVGGTPKAGAPAHLSAARSRARFITSPKAGASMNDLFSLEGRTALVTGGSRGIGRMIAKGFLLQGARVYISARKAEACDQAAAELSEFGRCVALPGDVSTLGGIEALVDAYAAHEQALDVLVNNAGAAWGEAFDSFPESGWDKVVDLNLKAPFFLTQALIGPLRKAAALRPAKVINIASIDGVSVNPLETYSYAASKAGLIHLTRRMALRLIRDNIVVSAIAPGAFASNMNRDARDHAEAVAARIPAGRIGRDDDMAGAAVYLASRAGDYVVGETLVVDGGVTHARGAG